jgi:hypothetical protein
MIRKLPISLCLLWLAVPSVSVKAQPVSQPFPYTPVEFMEKLVAVMDEPDQFAVYKKVEEVFGLKLKSGRSPDGSFLSYDAVDWYSNLNILIYPSPDTPGNLQVVMNLGRMSPLNFGDPHKGECLAPEVMESVLKDDGWIGGNGSGDPLMFFYRKRGRRFNAIPLGFGGSHNYTCIGAIRIYFSQAK